MSMSVWLLAADLSRLVIARSSERDSESEQLVPELFSNIVGHGTSVTFCYAIFMDM